MPKLERIPSPASMANEASGAGAGELQRWCASYTNTKRYNEYVFEEFTRRTNAIPWLKEHRDWVEAHDFGYGQRAFHYLFQLLVSDLALELRPIRMLEIGVFKGQTISLVALCAQKLGAEVAIVAISPFRGNLPRIGRFETALRFVCDAAFRHEYLLGNLHPDGDHLADARHIFCEFSLDFDQVTPVRGLSTSADVIARVCQQTFTLVFIDGDHSYSAARSDIENYAPLVEPGGYVVVDDAAAFLPGSGYFKGMKSVSRACQWLDQAPHFQNVLNVGHQRLFRRVDLPIATARARHLDALPR